MRLRHIVLPDQEELERLTAFGGLPEQAAPGLTLPVLWKQQVQQRPDETVIETRNHGRVSFKEMDRRSDALAAYLVSAYGVQPGDRVVVMLPRTPEVLISHLAIMKAGAAFVPCRSVLSCTPESLYPGEQRRTACEYPTATRKGCSFPY